MKVPNPSVWIAIPGFKCLYEIRSIDGLTEVRSLQYTPPTLLKPLEERGRRYFRLRTPDGKEVKKDSGRWLLLTFVGKPPKRKTKAARRDGNPLNDSLDNLYWASHQQVMNSMQARGQSTSGEKHASAKLTEKQVREIKTQTWVSGPKMGDRFGVSPTVIYNIRKGRSWAHVQ